MTKAFGRLKKCPVCGHRYPPGKMYREAHRCPAETFAPITHAKALGWKKGRKSK